jgi:hypothetical protein
MKLVGANPAAKAVGADELPGKANYFIGNDPKKWRSNVPTFAKVKYHGVYPGVDLVYYGNQSGQLEYDFVVAPGADPSAISLAVDAARQPGSRKKAAASGQCKIDPNGDLVAHVDADDEVRFHKPLVYQEQESGVRSQKSEAKNETRKSKTENRNPANRQSSIENRQSVEGRFVLDAENHIHFALGAYDHTQPLVIDPTLVYSTYLGGSGNDAGQGIAVDSSGNVYVTGSTTSIDFPLMNPLQAGNAGDSDVFVAKLSADGSALLYSTYLGGSANDYGKGIAIDSSGNAYVTGQTASTNFPLMNPFQANLACAYGNAFVAKLNSTGSALVYSTYLGGSGDSYENGDSGDSIAVDSSGNAWVTGWTNSPSDFPHTANAYQASLGGNQNQNAFVTEMNPTGSALVYSTYLGGRGYDWGNGIAVDSSGNAYVTGNTNTGGFPTTNTILTYQPPTDGYDDVFVAKFNSTTSALVYSTLVGGSGDDDALAIATDSAGDAFVAGKTDSSNFPTVNPTQGFNGCSCGTAFDAFVFELNPSGSSLLFSTYLGGSSDDEAEGVAVDSSGNVYVTGATESDDFPVVNPLAGTATGGTNSGFVAKLNPAASPVLVYSSYLSGPSATTYGAGIAADSSSNAYVTGATGGGLPTVNALQTSGGAFVMKISPGAPVVNLSSTSLTFGPQNVATTSASQAATLFNTGDVSLSVSTVVASGDFALATTATSCPYAGGAVPVGASCTVDITFTPTQVGTRTGSVTITDNNNWVAGSTQSIGLTGTGTTPVAGVSPGTLTFSSQVQGTSSASQPVTLSNTGTGPLTLSSIGISGDFSQTSNCVGSVAASSSCTINVTFTPTATGTRNGTLTITDSSNGVAGSTQTVNLSGTGLTPPAGGGCAAPAAGQGQGATPACPAPPPPAAGQANPLPSISQPLVPTATAPGGPGFTLTVNGTGFVSGSVVNWNGTALATTFVNSDQVTAAVPAANIASASTASITVFNPAPGGTSNVAYLEITSPTASLSFATGAYATGNLPFSVAVGDFNGDGKLDLAVADNGGGVSVLLGNGDGTFQPAVSYAAGSIPWSVAVGDFNGDGKLDLAVANAGSDNVSVLLGNGDGTFQPAVNYAAGVSPNSVAVGDFNGDGKLDLALADNGGGVSVLLGNGDGTFQPAVSYAAGTFPYSVAVGDFNGDGKLDLAVADNGGGVSVLLGNGDGTFQPAVSYAAGSIPWSAAVGDFNGDGKLDLAVANWGSNNVSVLLGNGDGTFQPAVNYAAGVSPHSVAVGDFNGDGKLDLAVANMDSNNVSVLLGNGDGTFQPAVNFATGPFPVSVAVGDFNGDGRLDLAVASFAWNDVSILLQAPVVSLSANSLTFGNQTVGTPSAAQTLTLSNAGSASLNITGISASGANAADFTVTNTCGTLPASFAPSAGCGLTVTFTPSTTTAESASISITDNAAGSPQTISLAGTGTAVATTTSITAPTITYGSAASVTVSVASGQGTIAGNVSLTVDNGSPLTQPLSGGQTTFTINGLAGGSHSLSAGYAAQGNYLASSATGTLQVNPAGQTINVTTAAPAAANYGTTFQVAATSGSGLAVAITTTGVCSGSGSGSAAITMTGGAGTCTVNFNQAGNANYNAAGQVTSSTTAQMASSVTTVGAIAPEPSVAGVSYTVNVTVSPQFSGTPSGTVTVSDDTGANCPITLSGGAGSCSLTSTLAGSRTITATYSGDANFTGSSGTKMHMVGAGPVAKLVLSPPNATTTAGQPQTYSAQGFDAYNNPYGDVTSSTSFALAPNGSCAGASCTATVADVNGSSHTVTGTYTSGVAGQTTLTVNAGSFAQLQLLVPGETAAPGSASGYMGTPSMQDVNGAFNVTVNAVDQYWNLVNTATDTVEITSTDPQAALPSNAALQAGAGTFNLTLETVSYNPATTTLTASDVTNSGMSAGTSPPIPVIVVYTASLSPANAATGLPTVYTLTVSNAPAPNSNDLGSLTVAIPANGGTPANISVTATQSSGAPATWGYDTTSSTATLMSFRRCTQNGSLPFDGCSNAASNAIQPGGTITIQFTATSSASVSSAAVPEVWTTTAYSDAAYTSVLPLAGPEPTVSFGAVPAITSANNTAFTYGSAGTFTVTTTGIPTPSLTETGTLPGGVTFTDNGNGTATVAGTPTATGTFPLTLAAQNGYGNGASQSFTLKVNSATATVSLSNLTQTYTGSPLSPAASTIPAGLSIVWTGAPQTNAGSYAVTATVNAPNYQGSASGTFTINPAQPTVSFTGAPASAVYQSTFTVKATTNDATTATITASGACSISGTTVTMTSGTGTCSLTATWPATTNYLAATASQSTTATLAGSTTSITSHTPNPSVTGQGVSVAFKVSPVAPATGTPSGNVTASDGTGDTCTATVATGKCTLAITTTGAKTITASYAGNANFSSSTSAGVAQTVNKASTKTTITAHSPSPSVVGQTVAISFTVAPVSPGSGTPTGNVTVSDAGGDSCTASVAAGTCSITFQTARSNTLTASYAGDSNFNSSTSAGVTQEVSNFTISASPSTRSITPGSSTTYTITLTPVSGFTGSVTLSCSGEPSGSTCTLSSSSLSLSGSGSKTSTATIRTATSTPAGTSTLTFTGKYGSGNPATGGLTQTATVTLTVQ